MKTKTSLLYWKLIPIFLFMFTVTFGQTVTEKKQITSSYNQNYLLQLQTEYAQKAEDARQKAVTMATEKGWDILKVNVDSTFDELMAVSKDGQPLYYTLYNVNAAKSSRVNHLHTGGTLGMDINGQNMTAHVWDGGATRSTHQEFDGAGGTDRVTINDGYTTITGNSNHATHVTGTILASGYDAAAKGMAPYAKALTHEWNNDLSEATAEAAKGMLVSNHSYGWVAYWLEDWKFGAYIDQSRDWDNLMYYSPYYLMVVAAGNDGDDNSSNGAPLDGNSSYDKLSGHAICKNNMVVACGEDANVNADGSFNSVMISYFSSQGPTDDYRIKPDITGNGRDVYSTFAGSDDQYSSISGTSMASPNVTGTLTILQQYYKQVNGSFMRAASLKGLALHTADDAGSTGPDPIYGWGLLNAKAAAGVITNNGSSSVLRELTLTSGQTYTITVQSDGTSPLKASISWTDPAGTANAGTANLTTPVLVNDLDIRVTQSNTTHNPWKLTGLTTNSTGDNIVDPFERVDISNASGTYTITVSHKGSLSSGNQNYTLVVTGLNGSVTNIPVTGVTLSPTSLSLTTGQTSTLTATVLPFNATNKNVSWASSNASVVSVSASGFVSALAVGSATITVTTLDGNKTASCTVTVTTSCTAPIGLRVLSLYKDSAIVRWNGTASWYQIHLSTGRDINSTSTTKTITGLMPGTQYTCKVRSLCGSTWSAYSPEITFTTPGNISYCTPTVGSSYQWISLVKVGSINNATSIGTGYSDYTSLSTDMALGMTQTINLVTGWATTGSKWQAWIDFNKDGDFTDSGEEVINYYFTGYNITASITVPATAIIGTTRMRVMMVNTTGVITPCSLGDGEVEDYTVNITMNNLKVSGIASLTDSEGSEASLKIYPNPVVSSLNLRYTGKESIKTITILDAQGRSVLKYFNPRDLKLDISNLSNGLYTLSVNTEKGKFEKKFIKQ